MLAENDKLKLSLDKSAELRKMVGFLEKSSNENASFVSNERKLMRQMEEFEKSENLMAMEKEYKLNLASISAMEKLSLQKNEEINHLKKIV